MLKVPNPHIANTRRKGKHHLIAIYRDLLEVREAKISVLLKAETLTLPSLSCSFLLMHISTYLIVRTASHPTCCEQRVAAKVDLTAFFSFHNAFAPTYLIWKEMLGAARADCFAEARLTARQAGRASSARAVPPPPTGTQTVRNFHSNKNVKPVCGTWIHRVCGQAGIQLWHSDKSPSIKQLWGMEVVLWVFFLLILQELWCCWRCFENLSLTVKCPGWKLKYDLQLSAHNEKKV